MRDAIMTPVQTVTVTALSLTTTPMSKPTPCNTVSSSQYLLAKDMTFTFSGGASHRALVQ